LAVVSGEDVSIREGSPGDLLTTFTLSDRTMHRLAVDQGYIRGGVRTDADVAESWARYKGLVEFLDAQPDRRFLVAENSSGPVAFVRMVRFGSMEQLTDLMVTPSEQGAGLGRKLLEAIWPGESSPLIGRLVIATGAPRDLSLYTDFGLMPVAGHWHMRQATGSYLERRSQETDATEPGSVVVLTHERAVAEWKRLEPDVIGHERPALHEFFGRDRSCLASVDPHGKPKALCWVSTDGDIGPAVGTAQGEVIAVVLAALDRVAKAQEPPILSVFACTSSWHLLHRLRMLGFRVHWPSWVMCSLPLPALNRYVPTRPPFVL
jgi:GNAT superfamily N-acetyltransferase